MANNISDIAAKAKLDISPFTRDLDTLNARTQNSVNRMASQFDRLKTSVERTSKAFSVLKGLMGLEILASVGRITEQISHSVEGWRMLFSLPGELLRASANRAATLATINAQMQSRPQPTAEEVRANIASRQARDVAAAAGPADGPVAGMGILVRDFAQGASSIAELANAANTLRQELLLQARTNFITSREGGNVEPILRARDENDRLIASHRLAAATAGLSANATERWRLQMNHATAEQLENLDVIHRVRDAQRSLAQEQLQNVQRMRDAKPPPTPLQSLLRSMELGTLRPDQLFERVSQLRGNAGQSSGVGPLDQGSREVAQILQGATQPQLDVLATLKQAAADDARRHQEVMRVWEQFTAAFGANKNAVSWANLD